MLKQSAYYGLRVVSNYDSLLQEIVASSEHIKSSLVPYEQYLGLGSTDFQTLPVILPDAIPDCDRLCLPHSHLRIMDRPTSLNVEDIAKTHGYQNLPLPSSRPTSNGSAQIPDLLNSTPGLSLMTVPDSPRYSEACTCRMLSPEPLSPPPVEVHCVSPPSTPGDKQSNFSRFGFYGHKPVSFKRPLSQETPPRALASQSPTAGCSANCSCFLDPVELNAGGLLANNLTYENINAVVMQVITNQLYGTCFNDVSSLDNSSRREEQEADSRPSRNKLGLRIDTVNMDSQAGGTRKSFYDPIYDFIMNSPQLKKLRELGFTYPKQKGPKSARHCRLVVALVLILILALVVFGIGAIVGFRYLLTDQSASTVRHLPTTESILLEVQELLATKPRLVYPTEMIRTLHEMTLTRLVPSRPTTLKSPPPPVRILTAEPLDFPPNSTSVLRKQANSSIAVSTRSNLQNTTSSLKTQTTSSTSSTSTTTSVTSSSTSTMSTTSSPLPELSTWLPVYPADYKCEDDQFKCEQGGVSRVPCLYQWERCDGIQDCSDGSDEQFCDILKCYGNFKCSNGDCLSLAKVCNGLPECADGSDELECDSFECQSYEYRCPSGYCIPHEWVCDGEIDCPDHAEEYNCSSECSADQFMCPEGWCIPEGWRCNGVSDCTGGADEQNCECQASDFTCASGGCISDVNVCDGIAQCSDGSDEWDCSIIDSSTMVLMVKNGGAEAPKLAICSDGWTKELSDQACTQLGAHAALSYQSLQLHSLEEHAQLQFLPSKIAKPSNNQEKLQYLLSPGLAENCQSKAIVQLECETFQCGAGKDSGELPENQRSSRRRRMVGGVPSAEREWPSIGVLYHPTRKWACTATILAPGWAITSALCVRRTDPHAFEWKFIAGSSRPTPESPQVIMRTVKMFHTHPSYKFRTLLADNDVMLVELDRPLNLSATFGTVSPVGAACLPKSTPQPGSWCITAGWGYAMPGGFYVNQMLKEVDMGVWDLQECNGTEHYPGLLTSGMICAGNQNQNWGPCFNDEGSPLLCRNSASDAWYVAGVLTSQSCGSYRSHPSIYSDVHAVAGWIQRTIGLH